MRPDPLGKAVLRLCYRAFWWPACRTRGHDWHYHHTPWRKGTDGVMRCQLISRWCVRCKKRQAYPWTSP